MEANNTSQENERKDSIELKLGDFWNWISKSEHSEAGHSVNLDKRIPGIASVFAVILFLVKEFIIHEGDEGLVFTDLNFTIALEFFNVVVLIIILSRGLKISKISLGDKLPPSSPINLKYIEETEKQFLGFIKSFFAMTLVLYCVLILNSIITGKIETTYKEKENWLRTIRHGRDDIVRGKNTLRYIITRSDSANFPFLTDEMAGLSESLKQIIFNDSIRIPAKSAIITHLQKIKTANERVGKLILQIDDSLSAKYRSTDTMIMINKALKLMYHGNHLIDGQSEFANHEKTRIILTHIFELIFSNIGALFLIYSFLVLYTKTIDCSDENNIRSLVSFRCLLDANYDERLKKTIRVLRFLFCLLLILTCAQIVLEFCFQDSSEDIATFFTMFSGLCNALALSLLVARFESRIFHSTFSVLVILYLYANIQVLFGVFNIPLFKYPHLIEDITLVIAFVGKCFLYLYILWILRTDRLKYYFYHSYDNLLVTKEKMEWEDFIRYLT